MFRWLESGWPLAGQGFGDRHPVRIEDYIEGGNYIVRAELPGFDPEKDVHIAVEGTTLSITATRSREERDKGRSEFHYGSFGRAVTLPVGADAGAVTATYDAGILTVVVPLKEAAEVRQIPVTVQKKTR